MGFALNKRPRLIVDLAAAEAFRFKAPSIANLKIILQNERMKKKIKKNGFSFFLIITFSFSAHASTVGKRLRICSQDSDCIIVDGAYCGCQVADAQNQFAVNKKNKAELVKRFESERKKNAATGCAAGYSDESVKKCANLSAVCLHNICEVR